MVVVFGIMMICFLLAYVPMVVMQISIAIGGRHVLHYPASQTLWLLEYPMLTVCTVVNPAIVLLRSQDIQFKRESETLVVLRKVSKVQARLLLNQSIQQI